MPRCRTLAGRIFYYFWIRDGTRLRCSGQREEADSRFQTVVHEFTHLILDNEDYEYGFRDCLQLAKTSPFKAKGNADNWAISWRVPLPATGAGYAQCTAVRGC
jgi:hypothetical protein